MNVSMLSSDVLGAVRQNLGCDSENDDSRDAEMAAMGEMDVFDRYLTWNGIIGYSSSIWSAVENIKAANKEGGE